MTKVLSPGDSRIAAELVKVAGRVWTMRRAELLALEERLDGATVVGTFEAHKDIVAAKGGPKLNVQGNGVAVVPVQGMIVPKLTFMAWLMGADYGLDEIMGMVKAAVGDPDTRAVVLDIDSPGGLVDGVPEAAAQIRQLGQTSGKPIVAVANVLAASAAYWLASQAHEVVVSPSGEVGSVGVYQQHRDMSEAAAQAGVKFTFISAGAHKTDGNPYEPLSDDAYTDIKQGVDDFYGMFVQDVAQGRHDGIGDPEVDQEAVKAGTIFGGGRTFTAKRAVKAGLADRVATLSDTISRLSSGRAKIRRHAAEDENEPVVATETVDTGSDTAAVEADGEVISPEDSERLLTVLAAVGVR